MVRGWHTRTVQMADETNGTTAASTVVKVAHTDERIPEHLRALVESGAIEATEDKVKVEQKGKDEPATRGYVRLTAVTIEGALALVGGRMVKVAEGDDKGNGVLDYFNYGYDLGVRSTERNKLLASLEGPEKAIERGVKGLVAAGIPEVAARAIVIEQRQKQGLPV